MKEKEGQLLKDLQAHGIDEKDVFNKAAEGQTYIVKPFERRGAVVDLDKSIGGKGGFASSGDAREAITALGRTATPPADALKLGEALVASRELLGSENIDAFTKQAGETIPAFSKIDYRASGEPFTQATLDKMRENYDRLAGFKGAHRNLDNPVQVSVENILNLPLKDPGYKGIAGGIPARDEKGLGAVTDRATGRATIPALDALKQRQYEPGKGIPRQQEPTPGRRQQKFTGRGIEQEGIEAGFDRTPVEGPRTDTLRKDLGKQPTVDQAFLDKYNNNELSDNDLIKSLTNFVMASVKPVMSAEGKINSKKTADLQGFALERLAGAS